MDRNVFALDHTDIVRSEAIRCARHCRILDQEDLFQEGMLFLLKYTESLSAANSRACVRMALRRYLIYNIAISTDRAIRVPRGTERLKPHTVVSLDAPLYEEDGCDSLSSQIVESVDHEAIEWGAVQNAIAHLPEQQRQALALRFTRSGSRHTQDFRVICKDLGVSQSQARALVDEALAALRREMIEEMA